MALEAAFTPVPAVALTRVQAAALTRVQAAALTRVQAAVPIRGREDLATPVRVANHTTNGTGPLPTAGDYQTHSSL